jgi:hypothetical protein
VGGRLPIASVPKLDTYLTCDQPFIMIHGRNGFFGMALSTKNADTVTWQVDGTESRTLKFQHLHKNLAVIGGPLMSLQRRQRTNGMHLMRTYCTR